MAFDSLSKAQITFAWCIGWVIYLRQGLATPYGDRQVIQSAARGRRGRTCENGGANRSANVVGALGASLSFPIA